MATNDYTSTSSGRWDAAGSFDDAVNERRELARNWASSLDRSELHWKILTLASDPNAFTLYERSALLEVAARELDPRQSRNL